MRAHYQKKLGFPRLNPILDAVYFDAQYSFILQKNRMPGISLCGNPLAVIAFDRENDVLIVKQIQGVGRKMFSNRLGRWERVLLQMVIDWARHHGCKRVEVIRSNESKWYPVALKGSRSESSEYIKQRGTSMYVRYSVTPRRMGFQLDATTGRHVFSISQ